MYFKARLPLVDGLFLGANMIIDVQTHPFPDTIASRAIDKLSRDAHILPHREGTVASLVSSAKEAGVDISVILPVATAPEQVVNINDSAARINEEYFSDHDMSAGSVASRLLSFASMHPDFADYRNELRRVKELGFKGIKIHPVYQKKDIDDISFLRILNCAAELDLIVVTHAGIDIGFLDETQSSPTKCKRAWDEIGQFKFVLAHMGGWKNWDEAKELFAGSGVWIDTAFSTDKMEPLPDGYWKESDLYFLDAPGFIDMVNAFGEDRVLFGTDSPWSGQKESLDFIRALDLSDETKAKIFGDNAVKLLGMD